LQPWASCFTLIALALRMRRETEVPCTWCLCQCRAKDPIQVRNMSSLWWTPHWSKTESQANDPNWHLTVVARKTLIEPWEK
jgi:hypothetical protein